MDNFDYLNKQLYKSKTPVKKYNCINEGTFYGLGVGLIVGFILAKVFHGSK